jgi:uncharacterized protein
LLAPQGWRPTPFRQYILKIHSRCNLACDYCYVFAMHDQSWRTRPAVMSPATLRQAAFRIAESARANQQTAVSVVLHGGEPLLAGPEFITLAATTLRGALGPNVSLSLNVQTNGVLLTREMLGVLLDHNISVGVSLDGGKASNDSHRRYVSGRGSYDQVSQGVRLLGAEPYTRLFAGILAVIDVLTDPVEVFEALLAFDPPMIDFILPHGNWTRPPPARGADAAVTPYADWLIAIFDRWYSAPAQRPRVRLFEEIVQLCLGGRSRSEAVGLSPVAVIVVEADGSIEQVDTLRSVSIFDHDFGAALAYPAVIARQIGVAALSRTCTECAIHPICGGGYYPHRYLAGSGYCNPSVYCPDLYKLIRHIRDRLSVDVCRLAERAR